MQGSSVKVNGKCELYYVFKPPKRKGEDENDKDGGETNQLTFDVSNLCALRGRENVDVFVDSRYNQSYLFDVLNEVMVENEERLSAVLSSSSCKHDFNRLFCHLFFPTCRNDSIHPTPLCSSSCYKLLGEDGACVKKFKVALEIFQSAFSISPVHMIYELPNCRILPDVECTKLEHQQLLAKSDSTKYTPIPTTITATTSSNEIVLVVLSAVITLVVVAGVGFLLFWTRRVFSKRSHPKATKRNSEEIQPNLFELLQCSPRENRSLVIASEIGDLLVNPSRLTVEKEIGEGLSELV